MNKITLKDAVYGLAVADAVGVPYEFKERGTFNATDMTGFGTYNQVPGTWSDDTSMTIATCYSIKIKNGIDTQDLLYQFRKWMNDAHFTPHGKTFDIGNTTAVALRQGFGCTDEYSNGNGSLMRIIPLAFLPDISDDEIIRVSSVTHAHPISTEACVLYVKIAKSLLQGMNITDAVKINVPEDSFYKKLRTIHSCNESEIKSSGYVVHSFEAAIWCLANTDNYRDCVLKAVNLGSDTDTVAAIAGALAGIIYGYDGIPDKWKNTLCSKEIIDKCLF